MDSERFDGAWLDLPLDDERPGGADLPPVPPEDRGEGGPPRPPRRSPAPEPEAGPWYPASASVFVVWGLLSLLTMVVGAQGGEPMAFGLSAAFLLIYLGFFVVGARWFGALRRA